MTVDNRNRSVIGSLSRAQLSVDSDVASYSKTILLFSSVVVKDLRLKNEDKDKESSFKDKDKDLGRH